MALVDNPNPLPRASLFPRTLVHCRLFRLSHARRLFKARHLELERIALRTRIAIRNDIAPVTVYSILVRHRNGPRPTDDDDLAPWVIEHRYSEFAAFRRELLKHIRLWEASADVVESGTKEFMAMSNALRRPISHDFPRRHWRPDTPSVRQERCVGLQDFALGLLTAYVDVSVYLQACVASMSTASFAHMKVLAQALEAFLNVPVSQKAWERRVTAAIRALTDVDAVPNVSQEYACCICMSNEEEGATAVERVPGDDNLVRLPCAHQFHEDCILDWFSTSMTCPLCRHEVVGARTSETVRTQSRRLGVGSQIG